VSAFARFARWLNAPAVFVLGAIAAASGRGETMSTRSVPSAMTSSQKSRSTKPAPRGLVGVFRLLAEQHAEVASLFAELQAEPNRRAELWPTIRRLLVSHEKAEVREVFPVLRSKPPIQPHADHHDDEARELEQMIGQLDTTPYQVEAWRTQFDRIVETVLHHAAEEEQAIFPDAQEVLGEERANALEVTYTNAQRQIASAL
jgi:hemerythrin superfamily protein